MSREQRIVSYSGRVQGVGFRFTARRVAADFQVAGYVRNLDDGRVELAVEGEADEVNHFLGEIRKRFQGYIRNEQMDTRPTTSELSGFEIRY